MDVERKSSLRAAALAARRSLSPEERASASAAVVGRLLALADLRTASTVLLHAALREEVDVGAAVGPLHARGVRTLFPRVRGESLDLVATTDVRTLELGYRGILEPVGPAIDASVVDAVVLPGVAFDPHGARLGQGGGHYDRLLATLPDTAHRIGVCFACQMVPDVPRASHDAPVDVVITERATYRTGARGD